jgi:predicted DNA-binding protein (MmcQ/YjbR family)
MNAESIREYCVSLPHVTEVVQWGEHLVLKVGGKMFAVVALEPQDDVVLSFKATSEQFFELQEWPGIVPAPYLARSQWLALERFDAVRDDELKELLATSYRLVYEKLPKRVKEEFNGKTAKLKPRAKARGQKAKRNLSSSNKTKPKANLKRS